MAATARRVITGAEKEPEPEVVPEPPKVMSLSERFSKLPPRPAVKTEFAVKIDGAKMAKRTKTQQEQKERRESLIDQKRDKVIVVEKKPKAHTVVKPTRVPTGRVTGAAAAKAVANGKPVKKAFQTQPKAPVKRTNQQNNNGPAAATRGRTKSPAQNGNGNKAKSPAGKGAKAKGPAKKGSGPVTKEQLDAELDKFLGRPAAPAAEARAAAPEAPAKPSKVDKAAAKLDAELDSYWSKRKA